MMTRRVLSLLAVVLALAVFGRAGADDSDSSGTSVDRGRFLVYENGVPVAHEDFQYTQYGDSLVIMATAERKVKRADGTVVQFAKDMGLIANAADFDLLRYNSAQYFGPDTTKRGIVPGDTAMTVFVESPVGGVADRLERPPGRLFVLDSQLWTLLDVVGRNLFPQTFETRPVTMVAFANSPTTVTATVKRLPPETLRWGARPVLTKKFELRDENLHFVMWLSPEGHLLKLEEESAKLMVMREPPKVVPPARRRTPR